jgi:hypothetical protein
MLLSLLIVGSQKGHPDTLIESPSLFAPEPIAAMSLAAVAQEAKVTQGRFTTNDCTTYGN